MNTDNELNLNKFTWFHPRSRHLQNNGEIMRPSAPYLSPIQLLTSSALINYFRDGDFYVNEIAKQENTLSSNTTTIGPVKSKNNSKEHKVEHNKANTLNSSHSMPNLSNKISKLPYDFLCLTSL